MIRTWDYGQDASPEQPVFMWDEPTIVVRLRPSPKPAKKPGSTVDVGWNSTVLIDYTYDGRAKNLEFLDLPVDLSGLPCRMEVQRALLENGIAVVPGSAVPPAHPGPRRPATATQERSPERSPHLTLERRSLSPCDKPGALVRFRPGEPDYSHDFIGDGTVVVRYSYDGSAIWLELNDTNLPVPTEPLPYSGLVRDLLAAEGIGLPASTHQPTLRPKLRSLDRSTGRATIWFGDDSDQSEDVDLHGDGSVYVAYADTGLPSWVTLTSTLSGTNLRGVPCADRVAEILRHQNLPIIE